MASPENRLASSVKDVDALIVAVADSRWPRERGEDVLSVVLAAVPGGTRGWDELDDWAPVFVGEEVVAAVWLQGPLAAVFDAAGHVEPLMRARGLHVLRARDYESAEFRASPLTIERFAGRRVTREIDWGCFCVSKDLLYASH